MPPRFSCTVPLVAAALGSAALTPAAIPAPPPNIVVILADDLGVGDLGCYNPESKIPTPHLDRLAAEGVRFINAYCPAAVCTPTRYALLTGRYAWRTSLQSGVTKNWEPPLIEKERATLPGFLRAAGYRTIGLGKWHLGATHPTTDDQPPKGRGTFGGPDSGANVDFTRPVADGPTTRGFDEWFGLNSASEGVIYEQDRAAMLLNPKNPPVSPSAQALPRKTFEDFQPLLTERVVATLAREATEVRNGRPFFLYLAPYVPHVPLAVAPEFRGRTKAGEYGDYVAQLDHDVGVLLDALDQHGLRENTVVMFASDNGSEFAQTGEGHQPNAPYAGIKWQVREGGVRTPFLARWPGHIPAGKTSDAILGLNDLFATCAALAGQPLPAGAAPDSINQLPVLLDPARPGPREEIVVTSTANVSALRRGQWKFVDGEGDGRKAGASGGDGQLYDLSADPRETRNLVREQPERAAELRAALQALLQP